MVSASLLRPPVDWTETPLGTAEILDALRRGSLEVGLDDALDLTAEHRQWRQVGGGAGLEVWLVSWPAGSATGWHDHGPSWGALTVLRGRLTEFTWDGEVRARRLRSGSGRVFGADHVHDLANVGTEPALSLHAYSPRLRGRTRYELVRGRLEVVDIQGAGIL